MTSLLRLILTICFFLPCHTLQAETSSSKRKTICLNMIVKNESAIIERCLSSVLPIIDYWVIVDTGSTDGTQQKIKNFMKEKRIQGELYERPWVNFAHNRNEAIELSKNKADFLFFIDADEYLTYDDGFKLPSLDKDYYGVITKGYGIRFARILLVNNHLEWKWKGVLHEELSPLTLRDHACLEKVVNNFTTEGARAKDPQKHQRDTEILEAALKDEPNNSRYAYYLANSYFAVQNLTLALQTYEKCIKMLEKEEGREEEIFSCLLQIAKLYETLEKPENTITDGYKRAFDYRKTRSEPLYHLAHYYRCKGKYSEGAAIAKIGLSIPRPQDLYFVEEWMYDYGILFELSICAYAEERYQEAQKACQLLLRKKNLLQNFRECVEKTLILTNEKLWELEQCKKVQEATTELHVKSPRLLITLGPKSDFTANQLCSHINALIVKGSDEEVKKTIQTYDRTEKTHLIIIDSPLKDPSYIAHVVGYAAICLNEPLEPALKTLKDKIATIPTTSADLPGMDAIQTGKFYDLMMKVDHIFREHKIPYCAIFGTLLGAIRHQGMIPWDDDLDIAIPSTYKEELAHLQEALATQGLELYYWTPIFYKIFPKDGEKIITAEGIEVPWKYPFIDVFEVTECDGKCYFSRHSNPKVDLFPPKEDSPDWSLFSKEFRYPFPTATFGPMQIPIPHNAYGIITRSYGDDWNQVAYVLFNHQKEMHLKKIKVQLTDRSPPPYLLPKS